MPPGADLLAWLRAIALDGELARTEPETLRYRPCTRRPELSVSSAARQVVLRLPAHWPWVVDLAGAYRRIGLIGTWATGPARVVHRLRTRARRGQ